jgi:hypothetical protein
MRQARREDQGGPKPDLPAPVSTSTMCAHPTLMGFEIDVNGIAESIAAIRDFQPPLTLVAFERRTRAGGRPQPLHIKMRRVNNPASETNRQRRHPPLPPTARPHRATCHPPAIVRAVCLLIWSGTAKRPLLSLINSATGQVDANSSPAPFSGASLMNVTPATPSARRVCHPLRRCAADR